MSDCLHCDINELVDKQLAATDVDLSEVAAKVTESLADVILLAPPEDQAKFMADILSILGQLYLEKSGAIEGEPPNRRHYWMSLKAGTGSDGHTRKPNFRF